MNVIKRVKVQKEKGYKNIISRSSAVAQQGKRNHAQQDQTLPALA